MQAHPENLPIAVRGRWVGVFGQGDFWCAVRDDECVGAYHGGSGMLPDWLKRKFRQRYGHLVTAMERHRCGDGRWCGVPDIVLFTVSGARRVVVVEVKTRDAVRADQMEVLKQFGEVRGLRPDIRMVPRSAALQPLRGPPPRYPRRPLLAYLDDAKAYLGGHRKSQIGMAEGELYARTEVAVLLYAVSRVARWKGNSYVAQCGD